MTTPIQPNVAALTDDLSPVPPLCPPAPCPPICDLMNAECVVLAWLHDVFLGYGDPAAACYTRYHGDRACAHQPVDSCGHVILLQVAKSDQDTELQRQLSVPRPPSSLLPTVPAPGQVAPTPGLWGHTL